MAYGAAESADQERPSRMGVVIGPDGRVVFDQDGQVPLQTINEAISSATGLPAPDLSQIDPGGSFNEVNIEVTPG